MFARLWTDLTLGGIALILGDTMQALVIDMIREPAT